MSPERAVVRGIEVGSVSRGARDLFAVLSVVALAALTACAPPAKPDLVPSATGAEVAVTVTVIDNRYEPAEVDIAVGEAVRWVFRGVAEHDVVAADASFVSDLMISGEYVHVFDEAGEYPYDCSVHPEMTGLVRVRG